MPEYDLEDSVGYWIACTAHSFRRALEDVLVEEKITFRQWEVLAWLAENGAQSQVQLAERVGIETQTLVGVLQRMERDGWLERQNCSEDRRRKRIRVTEKAEGVWNRMVECCERVRVEAVSGLSIEEIADLKRICTTIRSNLSNLSRTESG